MDLWQVLDIFTVLWKGLFILIVVKIVTIVWKWYQHRLKVEKIAGPKARFFTGNLPLLELLLTDRIVLPNVLLYDFALGYSQIYSSEILLRFWIATKPYVMATQAEAAEAVLSSTTELKKTFEYSFIHDWLGEGLLTSTGSKWRSRRKLLTPSFHFRILDHFQEVFSEQSRVFVDRVAQLAEKTDSLDIFPLVSLLTLDMICETAMGTKLEAQSNSEAAYVKSIQTIGRITMDRILRPWLWPNWLFRLSSDGKIFYKNLINLHDFTDQVIKERKFDNRKEESSEGNNTGVGHRLAFLDLLLNEQKSSGLSDADIREEVDTFMFEGHDTTATGLSFALYLLGLHPEIQTKVQDELDGIFGGNLDFPINTDDLKQMRFLECVIKESQRLYPSVPFIGRELKEDLHVGNQVIPGGTTCVVFSPGLHRRPDVFPDPERFDPDRFLPENSLGRHPYAYVPFSAGPRNCIGQKFAMNEEKTVLAQCLRHFNFQSLQARDKIVVSPELISRPIGPLLLKFTKRSPTPS